jgi:hypothetical protein
MEIMVELASIPSNIHEVASPEPVPNSKNLPDGFDTAKVLKREQVNLSEAMVKPLSFVAVSIS